jgi:hypothetical protein
MRYALLRQLCLLTRLLSRYVLLRLTGSIPEEIGDLIHVRNLDFNGNAITGSIPATLGLLQLEVLRLGSNQVSRKSTLISLLQLHVRLCKPCVYGARAVEWDHPA